MLSIFIEMTKQWKKYIQTGTGEPFMLKSNAMTCSCVTVDTFIAGGAIGIKLSPL